MKLIDKKPCIKHIYCISILLFYETRLLYVFSPVPYFLWWHILGHSTILQDCVSRAGPSHGLPPNRGALQILVRSLFPSPHVAEQSPNSDHWSHFPWTVYCKVNRYKPNIVSSPPYFVSPSSHSFHMLIINNKLSVC